MSKITYIYVPQDKVPPMGSVIMVEVMTPEKVEAVKLLLVKILDKQDGFVRVECHNI